LNQKRSKVDQRLKRLGLESISNENFSEKLWPSSWALGRATCAKMTLNYFTYDVTHKKSAFLNQKIVFRV